MNADIAALVQFNTPPTAQFTRRLSRRRRQSFAEDTNTDATATVRTSPGYGSTAWSHGLARRQGHSRGVGDAARARNPGGVRELWLRDPQAVATTGLLDVVAAPLVEERRDRRLLAQPSRTTRGIQVPTARPRV
jgi:hypothetical protein